METHPLSKREYVWLKAYITAMTARSPGTSAAHAIARNCLADFDDDFPVKSGTVEFKQRKQGQSRDF